MRRLLATGAVLVVFRAAVGCIPCADVCTGSAALEPPSDSTTGDAGGEEEPAAGDADARAGSFCARPENASAILCDDFDDGLFRPRLAPATRDPASIVEVRRSPEAPSAPWLLYARAQPGQSEEAYGKVSLKRGVRSVALSMRIEQAGGHAHLFRLIHDGANVGLRYVATTSKLEIFHTVADVVGQQYIDAVGPVVSAGSWMRIRADIQPQATKTSVTFDIAGTVVHAADIPGTWENVELHLGLAETDSRMKQWTVVIDDVVAF